MRKLYSNNLSPYSTKKISLVFAVIILILLLIYKFTDIGYADKSDERMLEYLLVSNLLIMIFSKERYDDERTKQIRYFCLKNSFGLLIFALGFNNILAFSINYIYIVLFVELFYFALFYWANINNPKTVFEEKTRPAKSSDAFGVAFIALILLIYIVALTIKFLR